MINERIQNYIDNHSFCSEYLSRIGKHSWIFSTKKAVVFHLSSGGSTVKRIFSMDTVVIPIQMMGNGCILRPGFMKMDLKKNPLQI